MPSPSRTPTSRELWGRAKNRALGYTGIHLTGTLTWAERPMTPVDLHENIATGDSHLRVGVGRTREEYLAVGQRTFMRADRSLYAKSTDTSLPSYLLDRVDDVWVETVPGPPPLTYAKVRSAMDFDEFLNAHSGAPSGATVSSDQVGRTRAWRIHIPKQNTDAWISADGSFDLLRIRQAKVAGGPATVDLTFSDQHSHPTFPLPSSAKTLDEIANGR